MATRMELLALRARIEQASEGRDLLGDKRAQLLDAFRKVADAVLAEGDALSRAASASRHALALAEAVDGPERVASAGLAASGEIVLEAQPRTIMGVRFAEIERASVGRGRTGRGYSLHASTAHVDAVGERFEAEIDLLVKMAAEELRLRRLAEELRKVTRRVNALEQIIIPRLRAAHRQARLVLDERDREEHHRLLRVKRRSEREV